MTVLHVFNGYIPTADAVLSEARITMEGERIVSIAAFGQERADDRIDLARGWMLPGFIDVQVNGGGGVLFNDTPTLEGIAAIGAAHARYGTTAFLPTLISADPSVIARGLDAVDEAIAAGVPGVVGIHVEGPFINPRRKGIHAEERLIPLDDKTMALLTRPRRGRVMVTLAPELADPADLTKLVAAGVILSAGHSDATSEQAADGFAHGITGVTHLFNAMAPLHHRAPGLVGAAFDNDEVWCGLIADGVHVVPSILRLTLKAKSPERIMLVTDAMPGVGNNGAPFHLDGHEIFVRDGICTDAAGTLAGSGLDMASAVRNVVAMTGIAVPVAARMAAATPAAFLGLAGDYGALQPGYRADFALLDSELKPVQTWIGGRRFA
ncbi:MULTISPECIES: N-acetylglucosamine-6-phosphate deacetylase [Novosphingobium]|uniref:N-acetylglucosamine-6-phosphate deacetylase n=1 Tax=Novosphingobium TaxID=165696 RepID=UPI0022F2A187|nr:N-acetylglucosamine-6-phosphate deacetylase [Novosphingobium resinovorum]GLK44949.1 N-acetylglucosamine-6-phosphate deacetylase [Novosphingobium resinovorum]